MRALVVSAASSGAGKTTVTLGLLRALRDAGLSVASAKSGPDYIDPGFHTAATGKSCLTLDPWSADAAQLRARAATLEGEIAVIEGAMGLFDGAPDGALGTGSTADLAAALGCARAAGHGCRQNLAYRCGIGRRIGTVSGRYPRGRCYPEPRGQPTA